MNQEKKRFKMINSFALLFFVIIFAAILTHIIPAGQFDKVEVNGRMVVDPVSFKLIASTPASFFDVFRAVPYGLVASAMLVIGTMIIGGSIGVIQETGALNIGISKAISKLGNKGGNLVLILIFCIFATLGGFLGFIEASIPFIPLAISVAIGLGYDSIIGVAVALLGAMIGFSSGPTNPLTVGISQSLAGLPMFSGLSFRIVIFVITIIVSLHHILKYSTLIKADPSKSLMKDIDTSDLSFDVDLFEKEKFKLAHKLIILTLIGCLGLFIYGALNFRWYFNELSALFILTAVIAGALGRLGINKTAEVFIKGASKIASGALIIGVARGIQWILESGNIIDTLIYSISTPLSTLPPLVSAIAMLLFICVVNFFIPSGSGKAIITMPIMIPMADIVGISRQTTILAYQLGDGITNIIYPTLGVVLIALAFGKVPFDKWFKFTILLVIKLLILSMIFLFIAVKINYGPF